MDKNLLLEDMYYAKAYFQAAIEDLKRADNELSKAILINGNGLNKTEITNSISTISSQISNIDNVIIPKINSM